MAAITQRARDLCSAKGLDGFTMDELAEQVGVSRRTLFNYVPGKFDAVLGPKPEPSLEILEDFVAGGPTGHLLTDLKIAATRGLDAQPVDLAEAAAFRDLVRRDPRLFTLLHERFVEVTDVLSVAIEHREGEAADPLRTRLVVKLLLGLLDAALDESLANPEVEFSEHLDRIFDTVGELFAG